jgi:hypothetical protein
MGSFLNCDSYALAQRSGDCRARKEMVQTAEAIRKKQKFDAEAAMVETNKACREETRIDALAASKTFFVKFSEKTRGPRNRQRPERNGNSRLKRRLLPFQIAPPGTCCSASC